MAKLVAYKSNFLIEASYKLSLQEQRFMLSCIGKLDPRKPIPESLTLTASEFLCNFPEMGKAHAERELRKAVDRLWERSVIVKDPEQTEEFRWIQSRIRYHKGEARVTVRFSNDIKKYLTQLSEQFTRVALNNVCGLKSAYSIRIYELCKQYIPKRNDRVIPVSELRDYLGVGDAHGQFKDFKRDVLTKSLKELNEKTDLDVSMDTVKQGRKVVAIHLLFREKKQMELALAN